MEGDCHYLVGNVNAKRRVEYVAGLLDEIGLGGERVAMVNVSAAMGPQFAQIVTEMTKKVQQLGPNPLGQAGKPAPPER
jgi:F420-non-reducing hydrogenase iron-sulfur subunit